MSDNDDFLVPDLPMPEDTVPVASGNVPSTDLVLATPKQTRKARAKVKVQTFAKLVEEGVSPSEAARRAGTSLSTLRNNQETKELVKQLVEGYHLPAEVRKLTVRAALNRLLVDNISSDDIDQQKVALEAAKMIAKDQEVALEAPQQQVVKIDPALLEVLKDFKPPTLPEDK